ncbi:acetyl-CoA carboxylase biotin carboxylase subunit [Lichenibacterium dinghuense]|uniref:acetyl-CoA carboxylase biotin carboxylase subunit n=1 Tax=Lichenibacterium dinghuense TaxID=2895977 RepID=UPI001F028C6D|nr:acetyl-CoA carboxylase biotin carboxylase subunit [Lichenibacterium sp. 6Y81]
MRTLLIANRGEIAVRIVRTARRMGIRTVAVFSEADRGALHVELADEARPIGPAPARDSYLNVPAILEAARRSGADAVHPGYGFLSENADFAEACAGAGLAFVGPPAAAIRAMGSKAAAKALMAAAGVPVVPGYHGGEQSPAALAREADRLGYPVLIKASAGGGGKGMRIVEGAPAFAEALEAARGEARASFGDDRVLVERYLARPRHIEVQVFADRHGEVVHLFERDCSVQRRHQKVVEEAPAPGLSAERRAAMGRAACAAARAVGYEGAGTVEFIAEGEDFFFMEMNTRLQVEHPVTEMVTGLDLVEWQIRVARGEPLPRRQDELAIHGHAVEVRLCAEDPSRDDRPATGRLRRLRWPETGAQLRIDAGVRDGDAVTVHYDPMLAKVIAWGETRAEALARLAAGLRATEIAGVATNLPLLRRIVGDAEFGAGGVDTGFLGRRPELRAYAAEAPRDALLAAAAAVLRGRADAAREAAAGSEDPWSPWSAGDAWRLGGGGTQAVPLRCGDALHGLRAAALGGGAFRLELPDGPARIEPAEGDALWIDGARRSMPVVRDGDALWAIVDGTAWRFDIVDPLAPPALAGGAGGNLSAPMPGRIVSVACAAGDSVSRGQVLAVLEAMKVQMRLSAPRDGVVAAVRVSAGDLVDEGDDLVDLAGAAP